jgi:hypothetical protein
MHKNATKCNETLSKWCKNKHGASKIIDTLETYQREPGRVEIGRIGGAAAACWEETKGKMVRIMAFLVVLY